MWSDSALYMPTDLFHNVCNFL